MSRYVHFLSQFLATFRCSFFLNACLTNAFTGHGPFKLSDTCHTSLLVLSLSTGYPSYMSYAASTLDMCHMHGVYWCVRSTYQATRARGLRCRLLLALHAPAARYLLTYTRQAGAPASLGPLPTSFESVTLRHLSYQPGVRGRSSCLSARNQIALCPASDGTLYVGFARNDEHCRFWSQPKRYMGHNTSHMQSSIFTMDLSAWASSIPSSMELSSTEGVGHSRSEDNQLVNYFSHKVTAHNSSPTWRHARFMC